MGERKNFSRDMVTGFLSLNSLTPPSLFLYHILLTSFSHFQELSTTELQHAQIYVISYTFSKTSHIFRVGEVSSPAYSFSLFFLPFFPFPASPSTPSVLCMWIFETYADRVPHLNWLSLHGCAVWKALGPLCFLPCAFPSFSWESWNWLRLQETEWVISVP